MEVRPLHDTVVLSFEHTPNTSTLYTGNPTPHNQADVLAVGPGRLMGNGQRIPPGVSPGDRVLINRFSGSVYDHESGKVRYVNANDIIAIIDRPVQDG